MGLLLFLILINLCGFGNLESEIGETLTTQKRKFQPSTFHAKFVDDLTIVESLNLKEALVSNPERDLPDNYHARLGLKLAPEKSQVYTQIYKIQEYANENQIQDDIKHTKL